MVLSRVVYNGASKQPLHVYEYPTLSLRLVPHSPGLCLALWAEYPTGGAGGDTPSSLGRCQKMLPEPGGHVWRQSGAAQLFHRRPMPTNLGRSLANFFDV
jgi:hypothetical protein